MHCLTEPADLSEDFMRLFPPGVMAAQTRAPGAVELLLPQEAACLGAAVPARAAEFAAGRACARRALAELGVNGFALLAAADRRPVWPESIVGSITHTTGLCAAVVGRRSLFQGLGVDAEIVGRVSERMAQRICVNAELAWLATLDVAQRAPAAALVFAAKEAFYKCQSPLTGEWLGFNDIEVVVTGFTSAIAHGETGPFQVMPTRHIGLERLTAMPFAGRYRFEGQFVAAGIAIGA